MEELEEIKEIKRLTSKNQIDVALSKASDLVASIESIDEETKNEKAELESDLSGFKSRNSGIKKKSTNEISEPETIDRERNKLIRNINYWANDRLEPALIKQRGFPNKEISKNNEKVIVAPNKPIAPKESSLFWKIATLILGIAFVGYSLSQNAYNNSQRNLETSFLISATGSLKSPWISSGIKVNQGDKIELYPTGKIHLAIHHAVKLSEADTVNPTDIWSTAEGYRIPDEQLSPEDADKERARHLKRIKPGNAGRLLWCIADEEPLHKVNPDEIYEYNNTVKEYECRKSGILWFTINDVWIYEEDFNTSTAEQFKIEPDKWKWLKDHPGYHRHSIWFEDNVGNYLVQIKLK